jgi:Ca2+-binding EF-hand superfamily protein
MQYNVCTFTGYLTRIELQSTLEEVTFQAFDMNHIEILYQEFDKDENGKVDFPEFKVMVKYIKGDKKKLERTSSVSSTNNN